MTLPLTRRLVLGGMLASAAGSARADAPASSLRPPANPRRPTPQVVAEAESLVAKAQLNGSVAWVVADVATGQVLEAREGGLPLPPASTAKALTTLFAFDRLGSGHRFRTEAVADGSISGGRLDGDLVLVGGGDPTMDTDRLATLAQAVRRTGLTEVTGRLRYWSGAVPYHREIVVNHPEHLGYNPSISGLNLNYNRVFFEWKRQKDALALSMEARSERFRVAVNCARVELADRVDPVYEWSEHPDCEIWSVARSALAKDGGRWLPVRHPDRYAAEVFRSMAAAEGLTMGPETRAPRLPRGPTVAAIESDELAVIARDMLDYSTNVTAEILGLAASGKGTLADSARAMDDFLAGRFGARGPRLVDHSGLGDTSRVTAEDMVAVLVAAGADGRLIPVLKDIPLRDAGGKPMRGHPVKVRAKTGTLNFVSALAGYILQPSGRSLAFAIFTADVARRRRLGDQVAESPPGATAWANRSRAMQNALLDRWSTLYA